MTITKKFILSTIFIIIIGAIFSLLFKNLDNKKYINIPKPLIKNTELTEIETNNIEVNVELPDLPKEMAIYNSYSDEKASSLSKIFSEKYQLFSNPNIEGVWMDGNNKYFLSYSPISNQITFYEIQAKASLKPLNIEQSKTNAQEFINLLNLNFEVEIDQKNIVESTEYGYAYIIPFTQKIDEYDLYFSGNLEKTIKVFVTDNHAITKVVINNPSLILNEAGFSKTIAKNTVVSDIQNSKGTVLEINDGENVQSSFVEIKDLVISNVQVEYREDPKLKLIIPYYRFHGSFVSNDNKTLFVDIIYPVIETQK